MSLSWSRASRLRQGKPPSHSQRHGARRKEQSRDLSPAAKGWKHAGLDAGLAVAAASDHRSRRDPVRRPGDRDTLGRRADAPRDLHRDAQTLAAARQAPPGRRNQDGRSHRDARLEQLAPHGDLVRRHRHRRDRAHREPASVPRADRLDHQPRRGPRDDGRPHLRAAAREARRPAAGHREIRHPHRCREHAEDEPAERRRLRGLAGRGGCRFRVAGVRREHRGWPLLHVGHHRIAEGCALFASLQRDPRDAGLHHGLARLHLGRHGADGRADVPRQRLVARLFAADGGRADRAAGPEARRRIGLQPHGGRRRHDERRRADGVEDAARRRCASVAASRRR